MPSGVVHTLDPKVRTGLITAVYRCLAFWNDAP
jgi:hypothetical protein